ncbi:hypothetical protein NDU88_003982 [Pleurodeles waltl]|uniref:Uncharacterized protein n=1 Tax=Pleurodeles waltl TaxID=8319 RepID=A0AAV7VHW8_PLEWA|nr:hypothetical protein NDU88_003982 [Pleurodeles waltl]
MTLFVTPLRLNECNVATLLSNQIDAETRPESTWLKNDTRLVNAVAGSALAKLPIPTRFKKTSVLSSMHTPSLVLQRSNTGRGLLLCGRYEDRG